MAGQPVTPVDAITDDIDFCLSLSFEVKPASLRTSLQSHLVHARRGALVTLGPRSHASHLPVWCDYHGVPLLDRHEPCPRTLTQYGNVALACADTVFG